MKIQTNDAVGKIVAQDYRAADVFHKRGIDFCCGGKKSLDIACAEKGMDTEGVIAELETALADDTQAEMGFDKMPLDELARYIEEKHHKYVRESLPVLLHYVEKVERTHGGNYPELVTLHEVFSETYEDLQFHLDKEERMIFPYVRALVKAQQEGGSLPFTPFGSVANPIRVMNDEHDTEGDRFRRIRALLNDYEVPRYACMTWRVMLQKLEEFEKDLHEHIHLENNILFPKTELLENALNAAKMN